MGQLLAGGPAGDWRGIARATGISIAAVNAPEDIFAGALQVDDVLILWAAADAARPVEVEGNRGAAAGARSTCTAVGPRGTSRHRKRIASAFTLALVGRNAAAVELRTNARTVGTAGKRFASTSGARTGTRTGTRAGDILGLRLTGSDNHICVVARHSKAEFDVELAIAKLTRARLGRRYCELSALEL